MSTGASDGVFLSALQPNSSVTTYGLPSHIRLGNGSSASDEASRAQRVQQQVQMRLAEKCTLPRQNGSAAHYAMSGTVNARRHVTLLRLRTRDGVELRERRRQVQVAGGGVQDLQRGKSCSCCFYLRVFLAVAQELLGRFSRSLA